MTDYRIHRPAAPTRLAAPVPTPRESSPAIWAGAGAVGMLLIVALVLGVAKGGWSWPVGVKSGPRGVVILRESAEDTPATARLWTALRNPPHSDYLTSKGHKLDILDDDQSAEWAGVLKGVPLPAVAIYDLESRKILDKRTIVPEDGATAIIGFLKAKGG